MERTLAGRGWHWAWDRTRVYTRGWRRWEAPQTPSLIYPELWGPVEVMAQLQSSWDMSCLFIYEEKVKNDQGDRLLSFSNRSKNVTTGSIKAHQAW